MDDQHEVSAPAADDPRVEAVRQGATLHRDDVPPDEARDRAAHAVADLGDGRVQAFTVPLAVNRVRDELNAEHGHAGQGGPPEPSRQPTD